MSSDEEGIIEDEDFSNEFDDVPLTDDEEVDEDEMYDES